MAADQDQTNTIELQTNDTDSASPQVDAAALATALSFGATVPPLGLSFAKALAIETEASMAQRLEGAENFMLGADTDRQFGGKARADRDRDADENSINYAVTLLDQNERERRRVQEEWSHKTSTVAGVTMDNSAWFALAKRLREDDELRSKVVAAFEARGMTADAANARYDRVAEIAEIAAIPPSQRTDEQNETFRKAQADPTLKSDLETVKRFAGDDPTSDKASNFNGSFARAATGSAPAATSTLPAPIVRPVTTVDGMGM